MLILITITTRSLSVDLRSYFCPWEAIAFVVAMASGVVNRVERQIIITSSSGDSDSADEATALPTFDVDCRGWTTICFSISKKRFIIKLNGEIIDAPPQKQILLVAVNPVRTMPDEWTIGGCTMFIISPGNTDENDKQGYVPTG